MAAVHAGIDLGGVGYLVLASARTLSLLGAVGDAVSVQTEMQVREESITLFGFATVGERDWFRLLTSVQGVGGRVALAILSTLSPEELQTAIARADKRSEEHTSELQSLMRHSYAVCCLKKKKT